MAKLLLVEDDNNLREIYEARLQAEGYTIVSARDGEEALVVAKAEKPDLVISDVMMPKISGFEMLDIMRNTSELKNVKVIMLTALGQSDDQQRADKLGADRYLVKSQVTLEDIVKVAHELLDPNATPASAGSAADTTPDAAAAKTDTPPKAEEPSKPAAAATPEPATPAEPVTPAPAEKPAEAEPVAEPPAASTDTVDTKPETPATPPAPAPNPKETKEEAKSTVQEEADVEAKIEDFVAGATTEPTEPGASPVTTPPPDTGSSATKPDDTAKDSASATDDKLMADAVDALVDSADKGSAPAAGSAPASATPAPASGPTVIPVTSAPDEADTAKTDTPPDSKPEESPMIDKSSGGSVSHNKVIEPLESGPKKDINDLLAVEEAKSAPATPGATVVVGDTTKDEAKPAAKDEPGKADPNSIAL